MKLSPNHLTVRLPKTRGFTLIELLTVIAIIGILAAIIIPVVGTVRSSAHNSKCVSQLRQVGAGYLLWSGDNRGKLLPIGDPNNEASLWFTKMAEGGYATLKKLDNGNPNAVESQITEENSVWLCPEATRAKPDSKTISYGLSKYFAGTVSNQAKNTIPNPSRTWMIGEACRYASPAEPLGIGWYDIDLPTGAGFPLPSGSGEALPAARHSSLKKSSVCMFDGHVESLTREQLSSKDGTAWRYFTYK